MGRKWTEEQKREASEYHKELHANRKHLINKWSPLAPPAIGFHVSVKADLDELTGWPPENVAAFLDGIGKIVAASNIR